MLFVLLMVVAIKVMVTGMVRTTFVKTVTKAGAKAVARTALSCAE